MGAKFQSDNSNTEGLVRVYTNRRTDRQHGYGEIDSACQPDHLYKSFLFGVTNIVANLLYPIQGIISERVL